MILTEQESADLEEIWRLLIEAYAHYFTYEGHCKSGEGIVTLNFPTYWELVEGQRSPSCTVYSYCLGPSRSHYFESIGAAVTEVRRWHAAQMAFVPDESGWDEVDPLRQYDDGQPMGPEW